MPATTVTGTDIIKSYKRIFIPLISLLYNHAPTKAIYGAEANGPSPPGISCDWLAGAHELRQRKIEKRAEQEGKKGEKRTMQILFPFSRIFSIFVVAPV